MISLGTIHRRTYWDGGGRLNVMGECPHEHLERDDTELGRNWRRLVWRCVDCGGIEGELTVSFDAAVKAFGEDNALKMFGFSEAGHDAP